LAGISSWDKLLLLTRAALEKKACDLVAIDVRERTSITDYFIICSGRSDRQVRSIAQGVEEALRRAGVASLSVEGAGRGHWVLMDFSDVVVHIFYEPVRQFYDLDALWGHAPRVELPEPYSRLVDQFQIASNQLS
jgi:ribosome-associated protein